jgi:hypothetical protein
MNSWKGLDWFESCATAVEAVTRYWPIVALIGLGNVAMNTFLARDVYSPAMALPVLVVSACISIVAYGKIAGCMQLDRPPTVPEILGQHGFNFLLVVVVVGIPGLVVRSLLRGAVQSLSASIAIAVSIHLVTDLLTLYVLPFVFRRRVNISAILLGVSFLFDRWSTSRWLILLLVVVDLGLGVSVAVLRTANGSWSLAISSIVVVLGAFGSLVVFAGALQTILEESERA